jgi:hypothetical protein
MNEDKGQKDEGREEKAMVEPNQGAAESLPSPSPAHEDKGDKDMTSITNSSRHVHGPGPNQA